MLCEVTTTTEHDQKRAEVIQRFKTLITQSQVVSIKKDIRHTFKEKNRQPNLDLRHFNQVMSIDKEEGLASVEGMTTFYDLVDATLAHNLLPQAVPELRSITVGGVIAGLGGQSSSFKFGLVHEMVTDFDLLTGDGEVIHCSSDSNPDIFYMLPNSYGSLGYVLRCNIRVNPVHPYVRVQYLRFSKPSEFFEMMEREVKIANVDFIEGASFSSREYVLLLGTFSTELPASEMLLVPLNEPFFKSVRDPAVHTKYLAIRDYIWRWDCDAFWATDQQNLIGRTLLSPTFRRTLGRIVLRSDRLIKIGKWRNKLRKQDMARYLFLESKRKEALIQDAAIPFDAAAEFDAWLAEELHIYPLWYCPVKTTKPIGTYPLYQPGSEVVVDFGFYTSMELEDHMDAYHYNKQIEQKLLALGGLKCLYSDTFFSEEQFWSIYDRSSYERVKATYDPRNTFPDLYQKVVNRPTDS